MDYRDILTKYEKEDLKERLNEAAVDRDFLEQLLEGRLDPDRVCTMEDIRALPESIRAELHNGKIFFMAPPTTTHQRIVGKMHFLISSHIQKKRGDCEVFIAPFGVYLHDDDSTFLLPDLVVICDRDKLDEKGCHGAPDWIIEVVSPSTGKRDYGMKLFQYRAAGVREYWVIDPVGRTVMVYLFGTGEEEGRLWRFEDEIPCSLYPDLTIRLADFL